MNFIADTRANTYWWSNICGGQIFGQEPRISYFRGYKNVQENRWTNKLLYNTSSSPTNVSSSVLWTLRKYIIHQKCNAQLNSNTIIVICVIHWLWWGRWTNCCLCPSSRMDFQWVRRVTHLSNIVTVYCAFTFNIMGRHLVVTNFRFWKNVAHCSM